MTKSDNEKLELLWLITKALYRASLAGFLLMIVSLPLLFMTDQIYALHNSIISLERPTYNALIFGFFAALKILILVFLLLPAIGLHWTIAKQRHVAGQPE